MAAGNRTLAMHVRVAQSTGSGQWQQGTEPVQCVEVGHITATIHARAEGADNDGKKQNQCSASAWQRAKEPWRCMPVLQQPTVAAGNGASAVRGKGPHNRNRHACAEGANSDGKEQNQCSARQ